MISLVPLTPRGIAHAQELVKACHYLRRPVDARCSVEGYSVMLFAGFKEGAPEDWPRCDWRPVGVLLFGRPEATKVAGWYGSLEAVAAGRVECSYWEVLNLARVWLDPAVQPGGPLHERAPGFRDRCGAWRSTLASEVLLRAALRVRLDYLLRRPPCFLEEPYQLRWLLSYCDTRLHRGVIYKAAGFELYRTNEDGIQTWRLPLAPLATAEDAQVRAAAAASPRSIAYRDIRRAESMEQLALPGRAGL